mmetsp:Transcript_15805/g.40727  ORF Transcript_15805/g.40727 Transcript_15805/m.40727 type:complete len:628 (-) Transcript_15805:297-2180(-)
MASSSAAGRSAKSSGVSCIQAVRDYISRMAGDVPGMKVLVMDQETTGIVSMVYTQTQILQHEVFLIDHIERQRADKMAHLKAIYFVRPTHENIRLLKEEFKDPKYGEYHLFFSNMVRDTMIQQLAEADEHEVVQQIQEYYADFLSINTDCVSLGVPSIARLTASGMDQPVFDRVQQGVCALLLALKKRPMIRYQGHSETATQVAESVLSTLDQEADLFAFRKPDVPPLLLLLDRRDDPVTPLLNQWTYQAMVHELLGISNNRVDLRGKPGVPKELEQVVLSPEQDAFFAANMFLNYGDLAEEVKTMMDTFQSKTKSSKTISSIADMQAFVEAYPEFRKMSHNVSTHVTLLGEINRLVDQYSLMEVSQVEQELACTEDHSSAVSEVEALLRKPTIATANKLRLVLLYALRYEREPSNRISKFVELLGTSGASAEQQRLVALMLEQCGANVRAGDLFGNKSMLTVMKKQLHRQVKGVQNVYTQHSPFLAQTLDQIAKGTLSEATHPYLGGELPPAQKKRAPTEIIVVMLGGATYEEARCVGEANAANPGVKITLAGTTMHSGDTFLEELAKLSGGGGGLPPPSSSTSSTWDMATGLAANVPDRMRIAALTSSVTSSVQQGAQQALSKLQ